MGVYIHVDWPPLGRPEVDYFEAPGDSLARAAREQIHFLPQSHWLCEGDALAVHMACEYECFADEVRRVAKRLQLPAEEVPHVTILHMRAFRNTLMKK
jgi:hypothetical protein